MIIRAKIQFSFLQHFFLHEVVPVEQARYSDCPKLRHQFLECLFLKTYQKLTLLIWALFNFSCQALE